MGSNLINGKEVVSADLVVGQNRILPFTSLKEAAATLSDDEIGIVYNNDMGFVQDLGQIWTYLHNDPIYALAADGEAVFHAGLNGSVVPNVVRLDPQSATLVWGMLSTGGTGAVKSLFSDGLDLYVAQINATNGYDLLRLDRDTGTIVWGVDFTLSHGAPTQVRNVYSDGNAVFIASVNASNNARVMRIDRTAGAVYWSWIDTVNNDQFVCSDGQAVYSAGNLDSGSHTIRSHNYSTGVKGWGYNSNSIIYTIAQDQDYLYTGGLLSPVDNGTLRKSSKYNGSLIWSVNIGTVTKVIYLHDRLYALVDPGAGSLQLYSIDASNGTVLRKETNYSNYKPGLDTDGQALYVGGADRVFKLNLGQPPVLFIKKSGAARPYHKLLSPLQSR